MTLSLHDIAVDITSKLAFQDVTHAIMTHVDATIKPGCWALLLYDDSKAQLRVELIVGDDTQSLQGIWVAADQGPVGDAFRNCKTVSYQREQATVFSADRLLDVNEGLIIPIQFEARCLGVLACFDGEVEQADETIALLEKLADYIGVAVNNAWQFQRVRELSVTDDVTSLYNARYLEQALEQEFSRSKRAGTPLSVIFIDLDFFKLVNDTNGHMVGSEILRETANILRQNLRATDIATRYGGDEFVLILPETDRAEAVTVAERCLTSLRGYTFGVRHGADCKVTASFGICTLPDDTQEKVDMVRLADQAMYFVKEHDRNNIATVAQMREALSGN